MKGSGVGVRSEQTRPGERAAVATPLSQWPVIGRVGGTVSALAWWWHVAAVAVIAAVVIGAAYQVHPAYDIAIGKRVQDDPLVRDFNAAERQPTSAGGRMYRWTTGESSIVFPGIGRNAASVTLTMAGGPNPNPDVTILANDGAITHVRLTPDFADYPITIPAPYLTTGNLTLTLQTTPFRAPGDRRELGILVSRVEVQPRGGIALPPTRTTLALWGAVMLAMLALLVVGLRGWEAAAAALLVVIGFALLLIHDRLFIALGAGPWLRVSGGMLLLAIALRFIMPPVMRWLDIGDGGREARWLLAVVVGVFVVRLGGLYHPAIIVSDLTFHVHRFEDVIVRHTWYQEIPALYDKNHPVPYPPGAYLLFAPFALFVRNRADLLTVGTQLLDASRILIIGLVVWKATQDRIAAACATLLAGIVPIAFIIFSWGNLTNAVGEWALTLLFAFLALGADRLRRPWLAVGFVAVVLLALLSHIGVAVTTVALLAGALGLWIVLLLRKRRAPWRDRDFLVALALAGIAGALAFALFYHIPLTSTSTSTSTSARTATNDPALDTPPAISVGGRYDIGGPRPDPSIGLNDARTDNPVVAVVGQIWVEGYAFYRLWPLLLAPLGYWLLWRRGGEGGRILSLVCLVWFGVALLLLVVGVLTGRYVRYAVTAIPAVAVGAGVALGYLWRWRWGKGVAIVLLVFSAGSTLLVWYGRITRAYHT